MYNGGMTESVEQIKDKIEKILQAELPENPSREWLLDAFGTDQLYNLLDLFKERFGRVVK